MVWPFICYAVPYIITTDQPTRERSVIPSLTMVRELKKRTVTRDWRPEVDQRLDLTQTIMVMMHDIWQPESAELRLSAQSQLLRTAVLVVAT